MQKKEVANKLVSGQMIGRAGPHCAQLESLLARCRRAVLDKVIKSSYSLIITTVNQPASVR